MRRPDITGSLPHQAWLMADELKSSLLDFQSAQSLLETGRGMVRAGEPIRAGAIEEAEQDLAKARARLQGAIAQMAPMLVRLDRALT